MYCRNDDSQPEPLEMVTRELTMPAHAWKLLDGLADGYGNTAGQYVYSLMKFYHDTIYESSDIVECRKLHSNRLKKLGSKYKAN